MSNSEIEQAGTVKGHIPNGANLSGRISNVVSLSGHISIGSGAGDFIIKMTIEVNGNNYTVTSCDKTMEQIDAAVASGQNIKAIAFDKYVMPMTQMEYSESYTFGAFIGSFLIAANVYKNPESGTDDWQFYLSPITADIVEYSNAAMPRISTVGEALDKLVPNSHAHANKLVLDKYTETDGKPAYDGEALGRDFVIKMTLASGDDGNFTVTSCDTTVEQIDEAVAAEKRVALVASFDGTIIELPMVQGNQGHSYYFCAFLSESVLLSSVYKIENTSDWSFGMINTRDITAEDVGYPNSFGEGAPENVGQALDVLITGFNATRKDILRLNKSEHIHTNKSVLDKFAETDGKPTYNGDALGSDFIIKMTVTSDDNGNYTVTSCDTTVEQIDAAVANEKRVVLIATDTDNNLSWDIPIVQGFNGSNYYFATFLLGQAILSFVQKVGENQARWQFIVRQIGSDFISYSNDALPNMSTVQEALDKLVPNSHTHTNKPVLDKFAESDGKPTYNGEALGGGTSDFIIKMTIESHDDGNYYTVTSCDTTVDQIDAAVAAEKRVVLIATDTTTGMFWEPPIVQAFQGQTYIFIAFTYSGYMMATVYKSGENEIWEFTNGGISAESINYYNSTQPDVETVMAALNKLFTNQVTRGTHITLADNTEYRLTSVTTLNLTYPTGNFECWLKLTFAASGDITVTLPTGTKYIGTTPDFKNGETWELSFKDKILVAQKVGDGT